MAAALATSKGSPSGKAAAVRGLPASAASLWAWATPMAPARSASQVCGITRSRRPGRTSARTSPRGSRARAEIQSVAERDPSSAHTQRASNAAVAATVAAARRACWRRSSITAAANSSSVHEAKSSASTSSTAAASAPMLDLSAGMAVSLGCLMESRSAQDQTVRVERRQARRGDEPPARGMPRP
jgi:hypothetical protein